MPFLLSEGALMECTMGAAPMPLNVLPEGVLADFMPVANIMSNVPMLNIRALLIQQLRQLLHLA